MNYKLFSASRKIYNGIKYTRWRKQNDRNISEIGKYFEGINKKYSIKPKCKAELIFIYGTHYFDTRIK